MDIDGIGTETVDALFEEGLIRNMADLYELTFDQVVDLERMADKSANNLIDGIEASKTKPFEKVFVRFGNPICRDETVAKKHSLFFKKYRSTFHCNV